MKLPNSMVLAICLGFSVSTAVALQFRINTLESKLPDTVMQAIDKDVSLSAMRNAKIDCEQKIPRTQECIILYEYIPVNK